MRTDAATAALRDALVTVVLVVQPSDGLYSVRPALRYVDKDANTANQAQNISSSAQNAIFAGWRFRAILQKIIGGEGGGRTHMPSEGRGILSPAKGLAPGGRASQRVGSK